jgi:hypothetical protein
MVSVPLDAPVLAAAVLGAALPPVAALAGAVVGAAVDPPDEHAASTITAPATNAPILALFFYDSS